jgi:hypothetical protein
LTEPSPELWRGLTFYQLGGVLHDLAMKRPLFHEEAESGNRYHLAYAVLTKPPLITNDDFDPRLISLARNCLAKDLKQRLERVRWDHFNRPGKGDLSEARRRLHLGESLSTRSLMEQEEDRLKLKATKAVEAIGGWIRDGLIAEGFPRHDMLLNEISPTRKELRISFVPIHASEAGTRLEAVIHLGLTGPTGDAVEMRAAFGLIRLPHPLPAKMPREPLWTTTIVELESDASAFTERFLAVLVSAYDMAVQALATFETDKTHNFLHISVPA